MKLTESGFNPIMGVYPTDTESSLLLTFKASDNSFTNGMKFFGFFQFPQPYKSGYSRSTLFKKKKRNFVLIGINTVKNHSSANTYSV